MGGNATSARQRAQDTYNNAKKNGVTGRDLETLYAAYAAAQARENSECNTSFAAKR